MHRNETESLETKKKKNYYSQFPKYFPKILRGNTFDNKKKLFFSLLSHKQRFQFCVYFLHSSSTTLSAASDKILCARET